MKASGALRLAECFRRFMPTESPKTPSPFPRTTMEGTLRRHDSGLAATRAPQGAFRGVYQGQ
jgi:hypothetical protein